VVTLPQVPALHEVVGIATVVSANIIAVSTLRPAPHPVDAGHG